MVYIVHVYDDPFFRMWWWHKYGSKMIAETLKTVFENSQYLNPIPLIKATAGKIGSGLVWVAKKMWWR